MDGSGQFLAESENVVKPCNFLRGCEEEMAKKTKNVTLSVHQAIFRDDISESLSSRISQIRQRPQSSNGQVVPRTLLAKTAVGYPHYPKTNVAVSMRFAFYEEGSQQSTVTPPTIETQLATNPTPPPSGTEFLDYEAVILVKGNHLIACGMGNRQNTVAATIEHLAADSGIDLPVGSFRITDIPNRLTVEKIRNVGVKSVDLNVSDMVATLEEKTQSTAGHLFGRSSGHQDIRT